jgi:drug/metabolite transporter (DMT)-like permease
MSWLIFAFSGPVLWAISTHIDKYLVEKYFKNESVAVLMVFTAIMGAVSLPFIAWFQPGAVFLSTKAIGVIAASGMLYMSAMYFYLQALQSEEASTVAPFFQITGLFALALGYFVLHEVLTGAQIGGGLMVIAGSVLLSLRFGGRTRIKLRLVLLMVACSFVLALSSLIFKVFAVEDDFWATTFWTFVGEAIFGVILLALPKNRRRFFALLRTNTGAVLGVNGANELINLGGGLGMRYALLLAPLAMVQAITSTSPFFVLFIGILLSIFSPKFGREEVTVRNVVQKLIATALAVAGVVLINR